MFDQVKDTSGNMYNNYARNNNDITYIVLTYFPYCSLIGNYGNYHFHFLMIRSEYR